MCTAFSPHSKPSLMNGSRTRYWSAWLLKKAQMWRCSRRTVPPIRIGRSVPRESRRLCEAGCKSSLLMAPDGDLGEPDFNPNQLAGQFD